MRRREFAMLFGGAAVYWPFAARAQQPERMRRIGVLMNRAEGDPDGRDRIATFLQALQQLGWTDGRNARIDIRWGGDDADTERRYAAELAALAPDVILAAGTLAVTALQHVTSTLPIVFVGVGDPVGAGVVDGRARPGGNITGFMVFEFSLSGKWMELLKEIAPGVARAAVLFDPDNPAGIGDFSAILAAARPLGVEVNAVNVRDAGEIERGVSALARAGNGGLIVAPSGWVSLHRDLIIAAAARQMLPAVYAFRYMVTAGGLISYAPDWVDQYRPAASYVDRILKGEKPADLPVQAPTKYELVINLKTAKALGLNVPSTLLSRADEVIE
jgi:putative tryptophan/tyrosine transport system substrate-binding protein